MIFMILRKSPTNNNVWNRIESLLVMKYHQREPFAEFRRELASVSDEYYEDQSKSVFVPNIIDVMHNTIEENRHVTFRQREV